MDALEFLKARTRMTNGCTSCTTDRVLYGHEKQCLDDIDPVKTVEIVEKWLAEHPLVTYASKMREVFPDFKTSRACLAGVVGKEWARDIGCKEQSDCESCWNREYGSLE